MKSTTLQLLLDEASRKRLTLVIGNDLPLNSNDLPHNARLAVQLAQRYQLPMEPPPALFQVTQRAGRTRYGDIIRFLGEQLATVGKPIQSIEMMLASLDLPRLITTRYDDRIERAFDQIGRPLQVLVSNANAALQQDNASSLLKLYGDLRQPESLTLSADDLADLPESKRSLFRLLEAAFHGTILFLGCNLEDDAFLTLWREVTRRLGRLAPVAYAALGRPLETAEKISWRDRNIELLPDTAFDLLQQLTQHLPGSNGNDPPLPAIIDDALPPPVTSYDTFILDLSWSDDSGLTVRVLASPAGNATATLWSDELRRGDFVLDNANSLRLIDSQIGDLLMPAPVGERWAASLAMAQSTGKGLRLQLNIHDPMLADVGWEAARIADSWPGLRPQTPIVRYVMAERPIERLRVDGPLRLLAIIMDSGALGLQPLDVAQERAAIASALQPLVDRGAMRISWLEGLVTRTTLLDTLRRVQPHLLHFVGHGIYDEQTQMGSLALARIHPAQNASEDLINATELGILLDGSSVRLAVINACNSAHAAGGVAESIVRHALPAALGMQAAIADTVAVEFAGIFYRALADRWPVDAAVSEARRLLALTLGLESTGWALPVLSMRTEDGVLFGD